MTIDLKIAIFLSFVGCSYTTAHQGKAYEPVNRFFTAESPIPRPDLECVVGVDSMAVSELYRVKCTEAWNISVKIDQKKANQWYAENHISDQDRIRRIIRYLSTDDDKIFIKEISSQVWNSGQWTEI